MNKRLGVLVLALAVMLSVAVQAETSEVAKTVATEYIKAFQNSEWPKAKALSSDAALSWVEYVEARAAETDGLKSVVLVETETVGESIRVKVYYRNRDDQLRTRYLRLRAQSGSFTVVDDRMLGREWVSLSYKRGLFPAPAVIDGIRITVLGMLEVPPEVKLDILVENIGSKVERLVIPSLESFYIVEADAAVRKKYFVNPPDRVLETPVKPGDRLRTYAIFPFWQVDPVFQGRQWKSLSWTLFVPFGPVEQFAIDYL